MLIAIAITIFAVLIVFSHYLPKYTSTGPYGLIFIVEQDRNNDCRMAEYRRRLYQVNVRLDGGWMKDYCMDPSDFALWRRTTAVREREYTRWLNTGESEDPAADVREWWFRQLFVISRLPARLTAGTSYQHRKRQRHLRSVK